MELEFNLRRDIVFFDIESTGLNVVRDRIVQIALIKYYADGRAHEEMEMMINPGIPISEEAMAVHGITPDKLANKPSFHQVAQKIFDFIGDADLSGYNSDRFDVPMLMEEFARAGLDLSMDHRKSIDVQKIFYKMEPRTLKAALKLYCGKSLEDAHDALADVRATVDVLKGQIKRYENVDHVDGDGFTTQAPIKNDMDAIYDFTKDIRGIDVTNRLKYDHRGQVVFNFGKYVGKPVAETLHRDKNYYHWIMDKEFSSQVKGLVKKLVKEYQDELKKK